MKLKLVSLVIACMLLLNVSGQDSQEQKDSTAKTLKPIENKAIVYIFRPSLYAFAIKMDVDCDTSYIGTTSANTYVYTVVDPGKHTFIAKSENKSKMEMDLEAGKIYYLEQKVKMGVIYARVKLITIPDEKGKKFLADCKLSKKNVYSN